LAEMAELLLSVVRILKGELREVEKSSHRVRSGPWLKES
jgi:hypothetical protein